MRKPVPPVQHHERAWQISRGRIHWLPRTRRAQAWSRPLDRVQDRWPRQPSVDTSPLATGHDAVCPHRRDTAPISTSARDPGDSRRVSSRARRVPVGGAAAGYARELRRVARLTRTTPDITGSKGASLSVNHPTSLHRRGLPGAPGPRPPVDTRRMRARVGGGATPGRSDGGNRENRTPGTGTPPYGRTVVFPEFSSIPPAFVPLPERPVRRDLESRVLHGKGNN